MITKTEILETARKDLENRISQHEKTLDCQIYINHGKEPYEYGYIQPWIPQEEMQMLAAKYKPAWEHVYFFYNSIIEHEVPSLVSMFVLSETPLYNLSDEYGTNVYEYKGDDEIIKHEYVNFFSKLWNKARRKQ